MLVGGITIATIGGVCFETQTPGLVAMVLAAVVVAYDAGLKHTPLGPLAMGTCRGLNGLLGMSVAFDQIESNLVGVIFLGVTVYIVGVTWFARSEEVTSDRRKLSIAAVVAISGIAILGVGVWHTYSGFFRLNPLGWAMLWCVVGLHSGRRFVAAIIQPTPSKVQGAVGNALRSIILINTALACGIAGPVWGLGILLLLPPTMFMARFIPQT